MKAAEETLLALLGKVESPVQCTPRRLSDVESLVRGETPGEELETLVKRVAARGAEPLNFNHFRSR